MRRRNGSTYNSFLGSGSGTRNRPIAPVESGPCCQDSPTALSIGMMMEAGRRAADILAVKRRPGGEVPREDGDLRSSTSSEGHQARIPSSSAEKSPLGMTSSSRALSPHKSFTDSPGLLLWALRKTTAHEGVLVGGDIVLWRRVARPGR